nr:uncharacterized protein LOC127347878 [Lolium perenne]
MVVDPAEARVGSPPAGEERPPPCSLTVLTADSEMVVEGPQQVFGAQVVVEELLRDEPPAAAVSARSGRNGAAYSRPPAAKGRRTKTVVVETTRKSTRNRGAAATPTMEKAQQRAAERNLEKGSPTEALSLIRAKERAQAALAEAAARREAAELAHAHAAREAAQAAQAEPGAEQPVVSRGSAARSVTAGEPLDSTPSGEGPVPEVLGDQMQGASRPGTSQGKRVLRQSCPVLAVRKGRGKRKGAR